MFILGISSFYHDSAACLIKDDEVMAAAQEERFTRIKNDAAFPIQAIRYCLDKAGISINQLSAIAYYEKPFLKFERLLETYYQTAPKGIGSFVKSMPVWLKEKLFIKKIIRDQISIIEPLDAHIPVLFPEHHVSHAASAYFVSPFDEAAILTIYGAGEYATATIGHAKGNNLTIIKELTFPDSLGLLYSAFTYYLGFTVNSGEYKVMGLAPYGNKDSERVIEYIRLIRDNIVCIKEDGSIRLNQKYFSYTYGLRMTVDKKWQQLFGIKRRLPEEELLQEHCDLASAIQQISEEVLLLMAREAKRLTGAVNLCMAGGVALNCVANGKIYEQGLFKDIYIQPAAGDAGGALGAAIAAYHICFNNEKRNKYDSMKGSLLGSEVSDTVAAKLAARYNAVYTYFESFDTLCSNVAALLAKGNVIGWMQGGMEFGPRALWNRSILANPRLADMQKKVNLKIKFREGFRPFAPAVMEEDASEFFDINHSSPYMLLVHKIKKEKRKSLPSNFSTLSMKEKLSCSLSDWPAITHVDYSARVQTVDKIRNERFYILLKSFKEITGEGILLNTSFNVRGEPVVCTEEDGYSCFMRTDMDYLVIGNCLFEKSLQPVMHENLKKEILFND